MRACLLPRAAVPPHAAAAAWLVLFPLHSAGLRVPLQRVPEGVVFPMGEPVIPVGRHIQYLVLDHPHGLTDRMNFYFRPLLALGAHFNATVHIVGGEGGPSWWLAEGHTLEWADSWGRYFDLRANGGNPFHEPVNFKGCKNVSFTSGSRLEDWLTIFDDGALCVNILSNIKYDVRPPGELFEETVGAELRVSPQVRSAARSALERKAVRGAYGSCHIRRCDRSANTNCTEPGRIYEAVAGNESIDTWVFFMYAEEGYEEALRARLKPLGKRLFFEDELMANGHFPQDNYFTYLVGKHIHAAAVRLVETHLCGSGKPVILDHALNNALHLSRAAAHEQLAVATDDMESESAYLDEDGQYEAVCGKNRLLQRSPTLAS